MLQKVFFRIIFPIQKINWALLSNLDFLYANHVSVHGSISFKKREKNVDLEDDKVMVIDASIEIMIRQMVALRNIADH